MISKSKISVRYAETDKMGVVYHTNYGIWYEIGRTNLLKDLGFSYAKMEESGIFLPVIELNCRYISPALYDDKILIETKINALTPIKISFSYALYKNNQSKPINTGSSLHAFVDKNMKIINFKKNMPELYSIIESAAYDNPQN